MIRFNYLKSGRKTGKTTWLVYNMYQRLKGGEFCLFLSPRESMNSHPKKILQGLCNSREKNDIMSRVTFSGFGSTIVGTHVETMFIDDRQLMSNEDWLLKFKPCLRMGRGTVFQTFLEDPEESSIITPRMMEDARMIPGETGYQATSISIDWGSPIGSRTVTPRVTEDSFTTVEETGDENQDTIEHPVELSELMEQVSKNIGKKAGRTLKSGLTRELR